MWERLGWRPREAGGTEEEEGTREKAAESSEEPGAHLLSGSPAAGLPVPVCPPLQRAHPRCPQPVAAGQGGGHQRGPKS